MKNENKIEKFKSRPVGDAIKAKLVYNHIDKVCEGNTIWEQWKKAKRTNNTRGYQYGIAEFMVYIGGVTPSELKRQRQEELANPQIDGHITELGRDFKEYYRHICKGCGHYIEGEAIVGQKLTCPKCKDTAYAPKTRTSRLCAVEGFFTNTIGLKGKIFGKGELNEESEAVMTEKYNFNVETLGLLADVADTEEAWTIYLASQSGLDPVDMRRLVYTRDVADQVENKETDVIIFHLAPRMKEMGRGGKPFLTAVCGEGAMKFRAYVKKKGLRVGDPVLMGHNRQPLTAQIMRRHLRNCRDKAGIDIGDSSFNFKTLRSFAFTVLTSAQGVMASGGDFGKFCCGKKVPPSIGTYLLGHREEVTTGYKSTMNKMNPNMAKYQETLSLRDRVSTLEKAIFEIKGQMELIAKAQNGTLGQT